MIFCWAKVQVIQAKVGRNEWKKDVVSVILGSSREPQDLESVMAVISSWAELLLQSDRLDGPGRVRSRGWLGSTGPGRRLLGGLHGGFHLFGTSSPAIMGSKRPAGSAAGNRPPVRPEPGCNSSHRRFLLQNKR